MANKDRSKIFIKNDLLENLERSKKGNLDKNLKLKLQNGLTYQLTPAVKFKEKLVGELKDDLNGKFFTYEELAIHQYDVYMDTAIINDETVYSFEEGFSGVLLNSGQTDKKLEIIKKQIDESIKEHKELKKVMNSLSNALSNETCDCYNVDILLEHFMKLLGLHLKRENDFLYNDFKNNTKLKTLTNIYLTSMDLINSLVIDYYRKWQSVDTTTENKDTFYDETKDIIRILTDRIKQEESVLFPALLN